MFRALAVMRCAPQHLHKMKVTSCGCTRTGSYKSASRQVCLQSSATRAWPCSQRRNRGSKRSREGESGLTGHVIYDFENPPDIDTPTGARRLDGHGPGGLVVEHSPATRETRVRFPARICFWRGHGPASCCAAWMQSCGWRHKVFMLDADMSTKVYSCAQLHIIHHAHPHTGTSAIAWPHDCSVAVEAIAHAVSRRQFAAGQLFVGVLAMRCNRQNVYTLPTSSQQACVCLPLIAQQCVLSCCMSYAACQCVIVIWKDLLMPPASSHCRTS